MQYLLLIYVNETLFPGLPPAEQGRVMTEYMQFGQSLTEAGQLRASERLEPTTTATCVSAKDGKILSTDGPYAETKEQLGGFYLVEAQDLDEAIRIAGRIPAVRFGGKIEVRPVAPKRMPAK
jgi:hypothetical protein